MGKKIVFNKRTGEFEETNTKRGCGCVVAIIIATIVAYMLFFA